MTLNVVAYAVSIMSIWLNMAYSKSTVLNQQPFTHMIGGIRSRKGLCLACVVSLKMVKAVREKLKGGGFVKGTILISIDRICSISLELVRNVVEGHFDESWPDKTVWMKRFWSKVFDGETPEWFPIRCDEIEKKYDAQTLTQWDLNAVEMFLNSDLEEGEKPVKLIPRESRKMKKSNYRIVSEYPLKIEDLGPWDEYMSVTNDIENVVKELLADNKIGQNGFFTYIDSEGNSDLVFVLKGKFSQFAPIPEGRGGRRENG